MTNLNGGFGYVDFYNTNFDKNSVHWFEYKNQKIVFELEYNYEQFCNYSETDNEFSDHSGYGGGNNYYYRLRKKTELSDLKNLDFLHNKTFENLLNGEMCVVRDTFIHCVDMSEVVKDAKYKNRLINGSILRKIKNCPYKSIKLDGYVLIVLGNTNNGNTKIVLKK